VPDYISVKGVHVMSNSSRGTGEPLTDAQRCHVRMPHSPNQGSDIDFRALAEAIGNDAYSFPSSFDWEMFEKGGV
jgi:hypothetical protein